MKVNPSIEESFIPMEVTDIDTLQKQKRKRNEHWARLKQARLVCPDPPNYPRWLEDTWGIRVVMKEGMITDEYTILDEKKYLMYLLKFG